MKAIFIIAVLVLGIGCRGQAVLPLYDNGLDIEGAYYKDINSDLDNFVGTWKYTDGTTSLIINLQKKDMQPYSDNAITCYQDILIGGYKYVENGVEKINTLPLVSQNLPHSYDYSIFGNLLLPPTTEYCTGCVPNMRRVHLAFRDPDRDIPGMESKMVFARADSGGVQKLLLQFIVTSGGYDDVTDPRPYDEYTVPFGEYLLVKQ
ncbi:hypothetical protein OGH69_03575 [Flavobacterium sp. MFBS3-15]|uniref:DUF6705 family protein n=1 Tax=Flavobacterium sp. MFBS3-15 TaxID=2989816 RepID=UPI0022367D1B|nr:DUF6705 family protein [Flavobacterium sp. MFBS3-15]MCW4468034.1 hypothetical protein [Flavobacterium sp. MFBS3-15]